MSLTSHAAAHAAAPRFPYVEWTREQGTSAADFAADVAADSLGNVFITGDTDGPLSGSSLGVTDAFLSRYDSAGDLKWTINIGSSNYDAGNGVSADNLGNAYVAGGINRLDFGGSQLYSNAFVAKYDHAGNAQWSRAFGTTATDYAHDVDVDRLGNVFVTGYTFGNLAGMSAGDADAFVTKFDTQGGQLWARQIGTNRFDRANAAAADGLGNVYITGTTTGDIGEPATGSGLNAFLAKFDTDGNRLWTRQVAEGGYWGHDIDVDGFGNVYVAGLTGGSSGDPNDHYDAYLVKFNSSGDQQWLRRIGGLSYDSANGVAVDELGNVFVAVHSHSNLPGTDVFGSNAFVMKFDSSGVMHWITQGAFRQHDEVSALAFDGEGDLYLAGLVDRGALPFHSNYNVMVDKIVLPEPSGAVFLLAALNCALCRRVKWRGRES